MDGAVTSLEALFDKATADLGFVARKLDTEFAVKCANRGVDKVGFECSDCTLRS